MNAHSAPQETRQTAPQRCKHTVAPVYYRYMTTVFYSLYRRSSHLLNAHKHRICITVVKQICINKTGTDICDKNLLMQHAGLLFKCLEINILHGLRGTVSRCCAKSLRTGY